VRWVAKELRSKLPAGRLGLPVRADFLMAMMLFDSGSAEVPLYSGTSSARVSSVEGGCSRTKVILFDQWIIPCTAGFAPRAVRASHQRDGFGGGLQHQLSRL
jgi:hypothetical protein